MLSNSDEEIQRIPESRSGVPTSRWKKYDVMEKNEELAACQVNSDEYYQKKARKIDWIGKTKYCLETKYSLKYASSCVVWEFFRFTFLFRFKKLENK